MASTSLRVVLEKMDNSDSDYRYMATSDLLQQLNNSSLRADPDTQRRLCRAVMKLLKDSNSEVQGMALKCLTPLALFVELNHTAYIVEKLLDHVLESDYTKVRAGAPDNVSIKAMRDVSSLALKSIVGEVKKEHPKAAVITKGLTPRLVRAIRSTKPTGDAANIVIEALELLQDVLERLGSMLTDAHREISDAVFRQLPSSSGMITKRAISCVGALSGHCDKLLFTAIVQRTTTFLQAEDSQDVIRTGVQIISSLSKAAGHLLSAHVQLLAPILFNYSLSDNYDDDDELREHCLQTLASFCLRCKSEMVAFGDKLVSTVITLAKYDPNYVDEDENENEDAGMDADDMDDEFGDDDDYSDDDDMSWKVRRAAIRCLHASITVELIPRTELCEQFGPFLVSRFKEREESVKADVFQAFSALLRLCSNQPRTGMLSSKMLGTDTEVGDAMAVDVTAGASSEIAPLLNQGPEIMRNVKKELNSRSPKTRMKTMTLLRDLVSTIPTVITPLVGDVLPEVQHCLGDSLAGMKTESLLLLRGVIKGGGAVALKDHIHVVMPRILATTDDRYYKVTAECLRFCGESVVAFGRTPDCAAKLSPLVPAMHDAALHRATAQDQDSEVKGAALHCLGGTVSFFRIALGDSRLTEVGAVFCDRLRNEVTRLATVRALSSIARSPAADVLIPVMGDISVTTAGFLRKNNSTLRSAALDLLISAPVLPAESDSVLIANISELIADSDLRLTSMALRLASRIILTRASAVMPEFAEPSSIYEKALRLSGSPLLQGRAVDELISLFRTLAKANTDPLTVPTVLEHLMTQAEIVSSQVTVSSTRSSPLNCRAKCVVAVCDAAEENLRRRIADQIVTDVEAEDRGRRIFSLVCLGEFGRSSAVATTQAEKERIRIAILAALDAPQDDMKTAAALALGGITAANSGSGVPALVTLLTQRPEQRYLLLISLKDAISSSNSTDLAPVVPIVLPVLLARHESFSRSNSTNLNGEGDQGKRESEEESVRTATAECLGLLACFSPNPVMKALTEAASSEHADVRASVAAAVKCAVSTSPVNGPSLAASLRQSMGSFIQLVADGDVAVAKNALQAVNAIARARPSLLVPHLSKTLQLIYARLNKDSSLVRVVDLGPFKHEEDYGLDMRKSAFDCVRTFISGPLCASIQLGNVVEHILVGLGDHPDVRAIAQLVLATAAATPSAAQLVTIIEPIVKTLEAAFNEKVKQNAVRQEAERHNDSIRGALRAVRMLETVREVAENRRFQSFMASIVRTSRFLDKYEAIGQSDLELMTFAGIKAAENGVLMDKDDVVMSDNK